MCILSAHTHTHTYIELVDGFEFPMFVFLISTSHAYT